MSCNCGNSNSTYSVNKGQTVYGKNHSHKGPVPTTIGECECHTSTACIPHYVVKTKAEARQFANAFVDVADESALYWIDSNGIPTLQYQRIKYEDDHEPAEGKYANKQVIDQANRIIYYYMPDGIVFKQTLEEVL